MFVCLYDLRVTCKINSCSNNQWLNTMQTPLHLHLNKTQWSKQMCNLTATVQGKEEVKRLHSVSLLMSINAN